MSKEMIFDAEARRALCAGFDQLAEIVKLTLGPRGKHVALMGTSGMPAITNDATLIAQEIELPDPFENMGAQLGREINQRTHAESGDGATTATVLAQALLAQGAALADRGLNPVSLIRGMESAADEVRQQLGILARTDLPGIPLGLVGEDLEMARRIERALQVVGKMGIVTFDSSGSDREESVSVVAGLEIEGGYLSPYFVTDSQSMTCCLEDVWILLHEGVIDSFHDLVPILERVAGSGKALLILTEEIGSEALATLVVNSLRGSLRVAAVQVPGWGKDRAQQLQDLSAVTGGSVVSGATGISLETADTSHFGWAQEVVVGKESTMLKGVAGDSERVQQRMTTLEQEIGGNHSPRKRQMLQERLSRLSSSMAVIHVGGASTQRVLERKHRYEGLLMAAVSARDEGVVTGGGLALLRAGQHLPDTGATDEEQGAAILKAALLAPLRQIAVNAGWPGDEVIREVLAQDPDVGFNASSGEFQNLVTAGILDAQKVIRCSLSHAVSIAGLILTTETLVADVDDDLEYEA